MDKAAFDLLPVESKATPISADELVSPLASRMPPVTDGQVKESAPIVQSIELKDARGKVFDPAFHAADENGKPKFFKGKYFYSKNLGKHGGRKPNEINFANTERPAPMFAESPGEQSAVGERKENVTDQYDLAAEVYLQSGYGPLIIALGDKIRPDAEEHGALKQSLAAWLRFKQATELSPAWGFAICATAVFVKKTAEPTVCEKLILWWIRIRCWFKKKD